MKTDKGFSRLLNESKGSILDDEELALTLQVSKQTSDHVTKALVVAQETEIEIDEAREVSNVEMTIFTLRICVTGTVNLVIALPTIR